MKQKLRRALNEQRQGLEQSDKNVSLYAKPKDDYDDDDSGDDSGDSDQDMTPAPPVTPVVTRPAAAPAPAGSALKVGASILVRKSTNKKPVSYFAFCHLFVVSTQSSLAMLTWNVLFSLG